MVNDGEVPRPGSLVIMARGGVVVEVRLYLQRNAEVEWWLPRRWRVLEVNMANGGRATLWPREPEADWGWLQRQPDVKGTVTRW